jgi:hypothetical protein
MPTARRLGLDFSNRLIYPLAEIEMKPERNATQGGLEPWKSKIGYQDGAFSPAQAPSAR